MIKLHNRYGYDIEVYEKNGKWYLKYDQDLREHTRCMLKTTTAYSMIDPPGGPAIFDKTKMNEYHTKLPNLIIEDISYDSLERAYVLHTNE